MDQHLLLGVSDQGLQATMPLKYANRHGLISGATGTGKTITLQTLAEAFSKQGVPVFTADVKGDLQALHQSGETGQYKDGFLKRITELKVEGYDFKGFPTAYWDCFGDQGIPLRATISEMGPLLVARVLDLNETQAGVLNIAFHIADQEGLLLSDLKDLRAMLNYVSENASEISKEYGNVSKQSVAAIQRGLLTLETQGAELFLGEPALVLNDLMRTTYDGKGYINVLCANKLIHKPDLYATFLLWLLSELYENLPEAGDLDKPKMVFFFDEAHLLFDSAPKELIEQIERVVRLIRSKAIGIFFVTQHPTDIPEVVLGQLANRVQHALRAYSPKDEKAVRIAAQTFRENPNIDTYEAITQLGVGEALVSFPDNKGVPQPVEQVKILPPEALTGVGDAQEKMSYVQRDALYGKYKDRVDPESAYEILEKRIEEQAKAEEEALKQAENSGGGFFDKLFGGSASTSKRSSKRQSIGEAMAKSIARNVAGQIGRRIGKAIIRGVLGGLIK